MLTSEARNRNQAQFIHGFLHCIFLLSLYWEEDFACFEQRNHGVKTNHLVGIGSDSRFGVISFRSKREVNVPVQHLALNPLDKSTLLTSNLNTHGLRFVELGKPKECIYVLVH